MTMSKHTIALSAALLCVSGSAMAADFQAGSMLLRARAVHLDSVNKDSSGMDLSVNNKWMPEVDFSYFFTSNLAVEAILTVPQKHRVYSGSTDIGSFHQVPPTVTLQYHFDAGSNIKPYVGAGLNYTHFSSVSLPSGVDIKRNSVGWALQAGVDIPMTSNMYFNVDIKKVAIGTNVLVNGTKVGKLKVDPVLVGVGVGWRF